MPHNYRRSLGDSLANLRHIHGEVAAMRNGIRRASGPGWEEYSPSDFLYSFVVFNTLYGIDWENSQTTLIRYYDEDVKLYESEMQERFLQFCFGDDTFVEHFKAYFINYVLMDVNGEKEDIKEALEGVRFGKKRREAFLNNFDDLLSGSFNYETVKGITDTLYLVRCNIFHGSKSIKDLKNADQRQRLAIYTSFLIALNQMVFSYLDYLDPSVDFAEAIEDAFKVLNKNRNHSRVPTRTIQPNK